MALTAVKCNNSCPPHTCPTFSTDSMSLSPLLMMIVSSPLPLSLSSFHLLLIICLWMLSHECYLKLVLSLPFHVSSLPLPLPLPLPPSPSPSDPPQSTTQSSEHPKLKRTSTTSLLKTSTSEQSSQPSKDDFNVVKLISNGAYGYVHAIHCC